MNLNITTDNSSQRPNEIVHLPRVCAANSISNTNSIDTDLVYSLINAQQVDQIGSERIFGRKSDFDSLGFDELDYFDCRLGDVLHVLSVREFTEEGGGSNNNIYAVHTCKRSASSDLKMDMGAPVSTAIRASSI